jgi:hypothetical protein
MPGREKFDEKVSFDGCHLSWQWETRDGTAGAVTINGKKYNTTAGALFLVSTQGGAIQVLQLQHDLSGLKPEEASFARLAQEDTDVARFVREAAKPEGRP